MNDDLFVEYQNVRGKLEWLIEQTSKEEVLKLLSEDLDVEIYPDEDISDVEQVKDPWVCPIADVCMKVNDYDDQCEEDCGEDK